MKNKQAIVGIVAAVIILLGAGGFLLLSKTKTTSQPNNTTAANQTNSGSGMMQGSIQDIFSGGKNQKCDFGTKTSSGGETKGTISVTSDKAYGNFAMTTNGKISSMYMIRNGETFYIWGDSIPTGIKMTTSMDQMANNLSRANYSNLDPNQKVDFKCSPWSVDESLFTPPANIKFTDVGGMMKNLTGAQKNDSTETNSTASQCNLCNSLTGDAKSTCKTSFNCQ